MAKSGFVPKSAAPSLQVSSSTPNLSGHSLFDRRNPLSQSAPPALGTERKVENLFKELRKICGKVLKYLDISQQLTTHTAAWTKPLVDALSAMSLDEFKQFAAHWRLVYPLEILEDGILFIPDEEFLTLTPDPPTTDECLSLLKNTDIRFLLCLLTIRAKFPDYRFSNYSYSSARFIEALIKSPHPFDDVITLAEGLNREYQYRSSAFSKR